MENSQMKWEDVSEKSRERMRDLGHFGPTVRVENMEVKGNLADGYGGSESAYFDVVDLRELAAAFIEVADWLEKRAGK